MHLRDIDFRCSRCGARATVELYNERNAPLGKFCRRHGNEALKAEKRRLEVVLKMREDMAKTKGPASRLFTF